MQKRFLVVGAGFGGAVTARALARELGASVLVIDERPHTAGNCFTERDPVTQVMVHRYGPHIFHTDRLDVWDYVRSFSDFGPFINRVKAHTPRGVFSLPLNLHTINQFFGRAFRPAEAADFLESLGDRSISNPTNFEEQALRLMGRELYENFFRGYTRKQWGCDPRELPAAILKRLPVRLNYDDNYYNSPFQGIPRDGYTALIDRILDHPQIEVKLSTRFERAMGTEFSHTFYTGPIDGYFGYSGGRLGYRTVFWDRQEATGDALGNAVINYTGEDVPYTRIHEHKHFAPWEKHEKTLVFTEFSKATGAADIPYYPMRLESDKTMLAHYSQAALAEERVSFLGRLGTYRYLDMHQVIGESLDFSADFCKARAAGQNTDRGFSNVGRITPA